MENKCPLCDKINPPNEWVCESCGAELPAKRLQQNTRPAGPRPSAASPIPSITPPAPTIGTAKTQGKPAKYSPIVVFGGSFIALFWLLLLGPSLFNAVRYDQKNAVVATATTIPIPPGYVRVLDAKLPPVGTSIYALSGNTTEAIPAGVVRNYELKHTFQDGQTESGVLVEVEPGTQLWMPLRTFAQFRYVKIGEAAPQQDSCGGASAICADGTKSYSQSRRGTCSHHGGVARWCN